MRPCTEVNVLGHTRAPRRHTATLARPEADQESPHPWLYKVPRSLELVEQCLYPLVRGAEVVSMVCVDKVGAIEIAMPLESDTSICERPLLTGSGVNSVTAIEKCGLI